MRACEMYSRTVMNCTPCLLMEINASRIDLEKLLGVNVVMDPRYPRKSHNIRLLN